MTTNEKLMKFAQYRNEKRRELEYILSLKYRLRLMSGREKVIKKIG